MTENIFFFTTLKNNIKFLYDNLTLREGMAMMKAHGFTTVPVLDQTGQYIGSISEGDLLWFLVDH
ncbi:MAG: CBS domain-containing protein, partial [Ileibacterium sp.]|nr:CBS domain-containing protein [Ileibacterium sp.]